MKKMHKSRPEIGSRINQAGQNTGMRCQNSGWEESNMCPRKPLHALFSIRNEKKLPLEIALLVEFLEKRVSLPGLEILHFLLVLTKKPV